MADSASCLQYLTDDAFLAFFEQRYLQAAPWQLLRLSPKINSHLISALRCTSSPAPMSPRPTLPGTRSSPLGLTSATPCDETHPSVTSLTGKTRSATSWSLLGYRYHEKGRNTGKSSVQAGTVEDALLAVGQGISHLGEPDPRKAIPGTPRNHPLLAAFLKHLHDQDDPARAYPANVTILHGLYNVLDTEHANAGQIKKSIIVLIIAAFFWLLRPAEYLYIAEDLLKESVSALSGNLSGLL